MITITYTSCSYVYVRVISIALKYSKHVNKSGGHLLFRGARIYSNFLRPDPSASLPFSNKQTSSALAVVLPALELNFIFLSLHFYKNDDLALFFLYGMAYTSPSKCWSQGNEHPDFCTQNSAASFPTISGWEDEFATRAIACVVWRGSSILLSTKWSSLS